MESPASALILPRLGDTPPRLALRGDDGGTRIFAAALAHAGVLHDTHLDGRDLPQAIAAAMQAWLAPLTTDLGVFSNVTFHYCADWRKTLGGEFHLDEWNTEAVAGYESAAFLARTKDDFRQSYFIGRTAEQWERRQRGLGAKLMRLIEQADSAGFGIFTPAHAIGTAQGSYWRGEVTAEKALHDIRYEAEDDYKEMTDAQLLADLNIPSTQEVYQDLPEWAHAFSDHGAVPEFPSLRGLRPMMDAANELAGHLRAVRSRWLQFGTPRHIRHHSPILEAERGTVPNDRERLRFCCALASPILVRWSPRDIGPRVFDDAIQEEFNNGCNELDLLTTAAAIFDPLDPVSCTAAVARFTDILRTATLTNTLLQLTTSPDEE